MDLEIVSEIADTFVKLKMFPYFDSAHFILMSMAVRDDTPQTGNQHFSRRHPFACWLATMVMSFAGTFLSNFLLGEPIIVPFTKTESVLLATAIWYLINYSPFDLVYKIARILPVKLLICCLKEVQRTRKIQDAVHAAYLIYPTSPIICVLLGIIRGAGYNEMRTVERLIRGVWLPASNEFLRPTFTTKAGLVVSIVFLLEKLGHITLEYNLVYLANIVFLLYFRLTSLLLGINDPFVPFENLFCAIFMGGLVDAVRRVITGGGPTNTPTTADSTNHVAPMQQQANSGTAHQANSTAAYANGAAAAARTNDKKIN